MPRCGYGYTLFEVIIAVALVAVMAIAIAPPLIEHLEQDKTRRALDDARLIAEAVVSFHRDVGQWPEPAAGRPGMDRPRLRLARGDLALAGDGAGPGRGGSGPWPAGRWTSRVAISSLAEQLIRNRTADSDRPLHRESRAPALCPGWNGPYLDREPFDPWGRPYGVNVTCAGPACEQVTALVLSAGPNGVFETPSTAGIVDDRIGGDDIGWIVRTRLDPPAGR